jgi:predicted ArsR family transcriptional regulator
LILSWERGRPIGRPGLTELAAAKFVESHGAEALGILDQRAETAIELGHKVAARTWRDMADAAARLLGVDRADHRLPRMAPPLPTRRASRPR